MHQDFSQDIAAVASIAAVPSILDVVCRTTGMGFVAIARVTEDRWVVCGVRDEIAFGLRPGGELKVETTICGEIRDHRDIVVIDHVAEDPVYSAHQTPAAYGFQSYISVPIVLPSGLFFGTLCAIDPKPRKLNDPATLGMFKLFAELIAFHLDAHRKLADSEARLVGEIQNSDTREQFIAVLGHDLRNPLASISSGLQLVQRTDDLAKIQSLTTLMLRSVTRMSDLIEDVLDFARDRLGRGFKLERRVSGDLKQILEDVVAELRTARPDREIVSDLDVVGDVDCDAARIAQMLSNLLGNALTHGSDERPVVVAARKTPGVFELTVSNAGAMIAPEMAAELFKPSVPAFAKPNRQGLGLGLYICSEIAKAHGGTLDVASTPELTCFTFRMPLA